MIDENQTDFAFTKSDKINYTWILGNHINRLMNDMRVNPQAFIHGVNGLEDLLDANNDAEYMKKLNEFINIPFAAGVKKIIGSPDYDEKLNMLYLNIARGKFRLLRGLIERDGLLREKTAVIDEGFEIIDDDAEESDETDDEDSGEEGEKPIAKRPVGRPRKNKPAVM